MRRQIAHLLGMAGRENVTIRLLPFSAVSHVADEGAFTLSTPPWEDSPNVLYQDTYLTDQMPIWRRSTFSNGQGGDCVEPAKLGDDLRGLRDSKDPHGPALALSRDALAAFIAGAKAGEFDDLA